MENTIESHQQKQSNSISVFDFMIYWEKIEILCFVQFF